jgi:hypothetical protein
LVEQGCCLFRRGLDESSRNFNQYIVCGGPIIGGLMSFCGLSASGEAQAVDFAGLSVARPGRGADFLVEALDHPRAGFDGGAGGVGQ